MAAALANPDQSRPRDPAEATFDTLVRFSIVLAAVALHLAYATGYGYFRDESYYLACANHLSFGDVDHPRPVFVLGQIATASPFAAPHSAHIHRIFYAEKGLT